MVRGRLALLGWTDECVRPHMVRGDVIRDPDFRQAAEEFAESASTARGGMVRREEFKRLSRTADLVRKNCIGSAVDQDFGRIMLVSGVTLPLSFRA